MFSLIVVA